MTGLRLVDEVNGRMILTRDWQRPYRLMPEEAEERKRETGIYFETFVYCRLFQPRHISMSEPENCYHQGYEDEIEARKGHKRIVTDVKKNPSEYDLREGFLAGLYFESVYREFEAERQELIRFFNNPTYRLSSLTNNVDEIEARLRGCIQLWSEELKKLTEKFKIFPDTPTMLDEQINELFSMFERLRQRD